MTYGVWCDFCGRFKAATSQFDMPRGWSAYAKKRHFCCPECLTEWLNMDET